MMRTTLKRPLIGSGLALALWAPGAAFAKTVCIHSTAGPGWTFVLRDASLRPGSSGAASGYAIRDDGLATPMSGGFVVFPNTILAGITQYFTGLNVNNGGGGTTSVTSFHQLSARTDGGAGSDWAWTGEPGIGLTATSGNARIVDCGTVPAIPKAFP